VVDFNVGIHVVLRSTSRTLDLWFSSLFFFSQHGRLIGQQFFYFFRTLLGQQLFYFFRTLFAIFEVYLSYKIPNSGMQTD